MISNNFRTVVKFKIMSQVYVLQFCIFLLFFFLFFAFSTPHYRASPLHNEVEMGRNVIEIGTTNNSYWFQNNFRTVVKFKTMRQLCFTILLFLLFFTFFFCFSERREEIHLQYHNQRVTNVCNLHTYRSKKFIERLNWKLCHFCTTFQVYLQI